MLGATGFLFAVGGPGAASDGRPGWLARLEAGQRDVAPLRQEPVAAPPQADRNIPSPPPKFEFPSPARWDVTLGKAAAAGVRPVRLSSKDAGAAGRALSVEVLDRAAAERVGASGFVFTVSGAPKDRTTPVKMAIDYSTFADAYGAGYASRLTVTALPDCALAQPRPADCPAAQRLAVNNDRRAQTLTVELADVAKVGALAVVSDVGGDDGTFAATTLSVAGSWQVSPSTGAFTYNYPVGLPAPAGGTAPSVSLSYSSAAVDGLTFASNGQGSPSGLGWSDFANAFIERHYEPCIHQLHTTDLCWTDENATISLSGISGPLLPVNTAGTEWRAQSDPGWRIERLTGAMDTDIYQTQYWKVTGPDGTKYYFGSGGEGSDASGSGLATHSLLGVPVVADSPGEPCWDTLHATPASCQQGWRWYLDRVEDPDGNKQWFVYQKEQNYYHSLLGALGGASKARWGYDSGAVLQEIYYGARGRDLGSAAGKVTFGLQFRCAFLVKECGKPSQGPRGAGYPDVPTDLICTETSGCSVNAPAFFTTRRYSGFTTWVRIGTGTTSWQPVTEYTLFHSFNPNTTGVAQKLQLEAIRQKGLALGMNTQVPDTTFGYVARNNRFDHGGDNTKAMAHNRLSRVTNHFGGSTVAKYEPVRECASVYPYEKWDTNVTDCFPQRIAELGRQRTGVFRKWLVTQVTESPDGGAATEVMQTDYTYGGDPAWAFDLSSFSRDDHLYGWSRWLGYGTVTITKGASKTKLRLFRGWDMDWVNKTGGGGTVAPAFGGRDIWVDTFPEIGPRESYEDHPALAGRVLEEQQLGTLNGVETVVQSRRHKYVKRTTLDPGDAYFFDAEWVGLTTTTESVATAPGVFKQRRSTTEYTSSTLQPPPPPQAASTLEEGWLDVGGDERCSITTYADNPANGMYVYPAANKTVAGQCTSTNVLSSSETYYDGSTSLGAAPTRGNPTRKRTLVSSGQWSEVKIEYDVLGRPAKTTDPVGAVTTTEYSVTAGAPVSQIPVKTTVTNALGHQTVTEWNPHFGVAKKEVDANNNATEYWYDGLGRLTHVWLPTEPVALAEPSWKFTYDIPNRAVLSQRLVSEARTGSGVVFENTWAIYDGFWREIQVQTRSTDQAKVLMSQTGYDDRGLVGAEMIEQAWTGTPGKRIDITSAWQNHTGYVYDELGREISKDWYRNGSRAHSTTTSYGVDTVTVTGPDGRKVRDQVDGLGRTIAVGEHDGQDWVTSRYGYDLADRLVSVTDPANNEISYAVNQAGWRTSQRDPNRGSATFTYDNAGKQLSVTDAVGNKIFNRYDGLGRPLDRRSGSTTGPVLASWVYDTAPGGTGALHRTTTHATGGNWVSEVIGYDPKGRSTGNRVTVPASVPGVAGSYEFRQSYDRADRVRSVRMPAVGGLPEETVTTDFDNQGLPVRMAGIAEYVWGATFDDRGRRKSVGFGPRPGGATWMARNWTYDTDQRTNGSVTLLSGGVVSEHKLVFDDAGNLTDKLTRQNGLAWRECFGYDARNRLTSAHTVAAASACAGGAPGTGDRSYVHSYKYSPDGRLTERVEDGTSTAYTYPAAGGTRPHAPTKVGATSYTWDADGNLTSRGAETFSWDVQGMLESVTNAAGKTSFVNDPSGQRLLRQTPDGRSTVYLAGNEITVDASGGVVSAVRPYVFDGQLVATRSLSGVDYLISDPAGSVEMAVPSGGTAPTATRAYEPFGQVRAATGDPATDRGFVGQIEDSSTGLSYLNARYYDAAVGLFVSTDPIYDTSRTKSLNPYAYSANNPATLSDPSGLYSQYAFGLETENSALKTENKALRDYIGQLQDVIRKQQKAIDELVSYAHALEAEIARQASIIRQLEDHIRYLQGVIVAQQREISRLRRIVAYQAQVIRYQAGVIRYYKNITNILGFRLWGHDPAYYGQVMNSIHSLRGIPAGAFDRDMISKLQGIISGLGGLAQGGRVGRPADQAYAAMRADKERVATSSRIAGMRVEIGAYQAWINDLYAEIELREICSDGPIACGMAMDPDHDSGFTPGDIASFIVANGATCLEYGGYGAAAGTFIEPGGGTLIGGVGGCVGAVGITNWIGTQGG